MTKQTPIFVVSSGRTGSTLLAKMIHRHPEMLCVSDIFEPIGEIPFFAQDKLCTGREFFQVLSQPSLKQRIAYWRKQPTTELLFMPKEDELVSLLLCYTLPFVSKQPMVLFQELKEAMEEREPDTMVGHFVGFFDWLRERFGRSIWVERTGGSLPHMKQILDTWPDAKIIHNYRDPRETAISMMTGSFFRLYLELTKNPQLGDWDSTYMPPVEDMGVMLNTWILEGMEAYNAFPERQKMDLAYEDLMGDTERTLCTFACFVFDREAPTEIDIQWAKAETAVIRRPPVRFQKLKDDEQKRLQASVLQGMKLLNYL